MAQEKGIWIITESSSLGVGDKGDTDTGFDYGTKPSETKLEKRSRITAIELKQNMNEFLEVIDEAFEKAEKPKSSMVLDEVELTVEINGKGQVSLFGTGGEAGAKGAIKLKFKRKDG